MSTIHMSETERGIRAIYDSVRKTVGTQYNGAFVPEVISSQLAQAIQEKYNIQVAPDHFLPAFWLKEVPLYPDAHDFLRELGQLQSSLSVIFTQGQVFDHGNPGDSGNLGFQNHKIEVAGIPWYFGNQLSQLSKHKLSLIQGGYNKTEEEKLRPILDVVEKLGIPVNYFDDLDRNLEEVGIFFRNQQIECNLYWVNRTQAPTTGLSVPVTEITSFSDIPVNTLEKSLVMLDYDGTIGDRLFMRQYLYDQVLAYAGKLFAEE